MNRVGGVNNVSRIGLLLLVGLALIACQRVVETPVEMPETASDYAAAHLLVTVDWLVDHLDDDGMRIVDVRGSDAYRRGHIPGAVNIPIGDIASTINGIPMEFDQQAVQEALNRAGLTPQTSVIIYDNLGMMNAARFFWTLEYVGHQDARVVNGGWNAWTVRGFATGTDAPQVQATRYPINLEEDKLATADDILARLDDPEVVIVDARSPQEYTGQVKLADRGGHIPGAVNLVWLDALTGGDTVHTIDDQWREELQDADVEVFKSGAEIEILLDDVGITPDKEAITYCQTLWRGAHVYYLLRLMGFERVRGYDASWAEWGNRPDLPVVTGSEPGSRDEAAWLTLR